MDNEENKPEIRHDIHYHIEQEKRMRFLDLLRKIKTPNLDAIIEEVGNIGIPKVLFCSPEDYPLIEPAFSPYLRVMASVEQAKGTMSMSYTIIEGLEADLMKKAVEEEDRRRIFWNKQRQGRRLKVKELNSRNIRKRTKRGKNK